MSYLLAIYNAEEFYSDYGKNVPVKIRSNINSDANYESYSDCLKKFKESLEEYYTSYRGEIWGNFKITDDDPIQESDNKSYKIQSVDNQFYIKERKFSKRREKCKKKEKLSQKWCQSNGNKYKIYKILYYGTNDCLNSDFYGFLIENKKLPKLVRDFIPDIIPLEKKSKLRFTTMENNVYEEYLYKKLTEEVGEFLYDKNIEELADIHEVLEAIMKVKGFSFEELEIVKSSKKRERGGFDKQILMEVLD